MICSKLAVTVFGMTPVLWTLCRCNLSHVAMGEGGIVDIPYANIAVGKYTVRYR